jgi:hypothetical protein
MFPPLPIIAVKFSALVAVKTAVVSLSDGDIFGI